MTRPIRSRTSARRPPSASISARIWSAEPWDDGVGKESVRLTDQLLCEGRRTTMIGESTSTAENTPAAKDSAMTEEGMKAAGGQSAGSQGAGDSGGSARIPRDCGDLEIRIARD